MPEATRPPRPVSPVRRFPIRHALLVGAALAFAAAAPPARAQGGPPPHVRAAITALEAVLNTPDAAAVDAYVAERLAPGFRAATPSDTVRALLGRMHAALGGPVGDVAVERMPEGLLVRFAGAREVAVLLDLDAAGLVTRLALGEVGPEPVAARSAQRPAEWDGLSWETLPDALRAAEEAGFSGVVLARRVGRDVVRHAYGRADRDAPRATTLETVYGIGSTPIDFTVTGVLLLAERGRLALGDTLGAFFPDVPADKRGVTLRHLMTGASGLPDFHDRPGDWDPDLAWVDRETAARRILAQPLLFAPGAGEAHSHSAFGLLAAVIEVVSGQAYPDFVRAEILDPLGMDRTGFYGETRGLGVEDFAVGYGASAVGLPNIPPNWGPTSWLVMGSGGMFSTLGDMARYYDALAAGRLLAGEEAVWQQGPRVGVGGSDRGYFIFRATDGAGTEVLLLMNGEGRSPATRAMTRALIGLVEGA